MSRPEIRGSSDDPSGQICAFCCCAMSLTVVIMLALSFKTLDQLDYGLNYNAITCKIQDGVFSTAGLYFLGVGHKFITFPKTIQTIEFVESESDRLQTRTSDGLPVSLSISFQYTYDGTRLRELYLDYKKLELEVYENTAKATIANVATNFSAYSFFNDKQGIAVMMQLEVTRVFDEQLMALVQAFQITQVELPIEFQDSILDSIEAKQNITEMERYKENMVVTFETDILVANQTRYQTIALAEGTAKQTGQQAEATAVTTEQTVQAEMNAYGNLSQVVGLNTTSLLSYIWWSSQTESDSTGKEFLVGLDPQSIIRTG
jgi:regulator of protease activity HflC (stomatin/prohibitin superfamily)